MNDQKEFNKSKLETKIGNINDSLDALMTKPQRKFRSKPRPKPEEQTTKTEAEENIESQIQFDQSQADQNITFNEEIQFMPGTLGKDYFTLTKNEYKAITGSISDLKDNDLHALRSLQTKLFVTFQYITDNLQSIYEEEGRLERHFDAVSEKIGELNALLRTIKKNKENSEREQIENFNQRKTLIHQHSLLNEREKQIKARELELDKRNNDLNEFRVTLEDRSKAIQMQQEKIHTFREKVLNEKQELDKMRAQILEEDQNIDEKYFEIKKQRAEFKAEYDKYRVELNTFKNIRKRTHSAREEARKAEKTIALKKRALNRISQQMEFQKKAFLTGKTNYQKLVDQVDHVSNEIERLEHRRHELINENLKLHEEKKNVSENLAVLRSISQNEIEAVAGVPNSRLQQRRPEGNA